MNDIIHALASFKQDLQEIKESLKTITRPAPHPISGAWLDGQEVMQQLHISIRTLQTMRDNGTLPYSRINGKFYYKLADVLELLEKNYSLNSKNRTQNGN